MATIHVRAKDAQKFEGPWGTFVKVCSTLYDEWVAYKVDRGPAPQGRDILDEVRKWLLESEYSHFGVFSAAAGNRCAFVYHKSMEAVCPCDGDGNPVMLMKNAPSSAYEKIRDYAELFHRMIDECITKNLRLFVWRIEEGGDSRAHFALAVDEDHARRLVRYTGYCGGDLLAEPKVYDTSTGFSY